MVEYNWHQPHLRHCHFCTWLWLWCRCGWHQYHSYVTFLFGTNFVSLLFCFQALAEHMNTKILSHLCHAPDNHSLEWLRIIHVIILQSFLTHKWLFFVLFKVASHIQTFHICLVPSSLDMWGSTVLGFSNRWVYKAAVSVMHKESRRNTPPS